VITKFNTQYGKFLKDSREIKRNKNPGVGTYTPSYDLVKTRQPQSKMKLDYYDSLFESLNSFGVNPIKTRNKSIQSLKQIQNSVKNKKGDKSNMTTSSTRSSIKVHDESTTLFGKNVKSKPKTILIRKIVVTKKNNMTSVKKTKKVKKAKKTMRA